MKRQIFSIIGGITLVGAVALGSDSGHSNHGASGGHGTSTQTNAGHHSVGEKSVTLSGNMIGLTCFIKHNSKGKTHKSCARDCAEKGLPIGLISNGKIYQITGEGHKSLKEAYKPLLKYLEEKVTVKAKLFEKQGVSFLVIEKIKKG